jgi:hypothetical protein
MLNHLHFLKHFQISTQKHYLTQNQKQTPKRNLKHYLKHLPKLKG